MDNLERQSTQDLLEGEERIDFLSTNESQKQPGDDSTNQDPLPGVGVCLTFFNLFNQVEGLGLLGLPYAFRLGGYTMVPLMVLVAIVSCATGEMLSYCLYDKNGVRVRNSYHELAAAAFGDRMKWSVLALQLLGLVGVCITYLVLIANAIRSFIGVAVISQTVATAIATGCCLPLIHFKGLAKVAYLSVVGVLVLGIVMVMVPVGGILHMYDHGASPQLPNLHPPTLDSFESFGLLVFAFSAHSTFPEHERSMAEPRKFPRVLRCTYAALLVEKLFFGFIAWAAYRQSTSEVVSDNLEPVLRTIVSVAIAINTLLSVSLVVVIFFQIVESLLQREVNCSRQICERTIAFLFCGVCARLIPHFALLLSIFGAFAGTLLTFIFPTMFYLRLQSGMNKGVRYMLCFVILVGCVGGGISLVLALRRLTLDT